MILVAMPSPSWAVNRSNYDYTRGEVLMGDTEKMRPCPCRTGHLWGFRTYSVRNNYQNKRAQLGEFHTEKPMESQRN